MQPNKITTIFLYRDINAVNNILRRGLESFGLGISLGGLESFGLGISLEDYKLKAFQIS